MAIHVRRAEPTDAATLHRFIVELAVYEKEPDEVDTTPEQIGADLAAGRFEALVAEDDDMGAVGHAIWFANYSTWKGHGIHLEDIYVTPAARGRGVGEMLLARLAAITVERGGRRLEWAVLDWNEPAIGFYRKVEAVPLEEWTPWRLTGEALERLASRS